MNASGMVLILAGVVMAPALSKPRDVWVGLSVCAKSNNPETFDRKPDGSFQLRPFVFRYLDVHVIAVDGDFVSVQHDDEAVWVKKKDMLRPEEAVLHYTEILDKRPEDQRAISCRCWAYMAVGKYDRALKDAEEAVRLSPNTAAWMNNRGEVLIKQKEYTKALAEFNNILRMVPGYFYALHNRSEVYLRTKKFDKALADIDACLANEAKVPLLYANKARILATCPDPKIRDGKKALEAATIAQSMFKYREGRTMEALAAAHAELGNFDKAVEFQQWAFDDADLVKEEGDAVRMRLKLYRDKKPFRDE